MLRPFPPGFPRPCKGRRPLRRAAVKGVRYRDRFRGSEAFELTWPGRLHDPGAIVQCCEIAMARSWASLSLVSCLFAARTSGLPRGLAPTWGSRAHKQSCKAPPTAIFATGGSKTDSRLRVIHDPAEPTAGPARVGSIAIGLVLQKNFAKCQSLLSRPRAEAGHVRNAPVAFRFCSAAG